MRLQELKREWSGSVLEYLTSIEDPRVARTRAHPLENVLVIALLAVICGAESFVDMQEFGEEKAEFLGEVLDLSNGVPSHDTFGRVFAMLNPVALQEAFVRWTSALASASKGDLIAIDGKSLRRSFGDANEKAFVHMVSAWSNSNQLVLGQVKTDAKSNEITAIPRLLKLLQLKGAMVTIDAMGCQRDIAEEIVNAGADYLLAVKDNQPTLSREVDQAFQAAEEAEDFDALVDFSETSERGHGRTEVRRCLVLRDLGELPSARQWTKLSCFVRVISERTVGDKTTEEIRNYICSRRVSATEALAAVRSHWGIENSLHWVLDVSFREDDCRVRAGNAAENFAVIRHYALNLLKATKGKRSLRGQRKSAGWNNRTLLRTLFGIEN